MKQPTFFEGVAVALTAALLGSILVVALSPLLGSTVLKLLIAITGLGYSLYLLARSRERVGRISIVAFWCLLAAVIWFLQLPLLLYLLLHLLAIWLVRSLYFYSSLFPALADLGLTGLSLATGIWALSQTGSLFLAIWSFFLGQALFVAIPSRIGTKQETPGSLPLAEDNFERAHRNAQAALGKLSSFQ